MTWVEDLPRVKKDEDARPPDGDNEPPHIMAGRAWIAIRALYRTHGRVGRLEGDHLELLLRKRWYGRCGYASFRDFVREELQLSPRTARRRIALSRLTDESPELGAALDSGRLSPCQVLALSRLRDAPDLPSWITMAEDCTVRDLEGLVTNYVSDLSSEEGDEPEHAHAASLEDEHGRRITFSAPVSAAVFWEHGVEMAQRVLGWQAPAYRCVEALLDETMADLTPNEGADTGAAKGVTAAGTVTASCDEAIVSGLDEGPCVVETRYAPESPPDFNPTRKQLEALQRAIQDANDEIESVLSNTTACEDDPDRSIAILADLRRKDRSLRLALTRLLREADAAGVFLFLGYRTVTEFLVARLNISERTAARFMSEYWTFENNPELARAFSTGRIGMGQAYLVNRVATSQTRAAFIERAETVTHLQFDREVRFLERLADFVPSVARQFHGPPPFPRLSGALIQRLRDLGWNEARIEEFVAPFDGGDDPAVDPALMDRLEGLLDVVALALEEHDLIATGALPTLATPDPFDPLPRRTTISFWAPEPLIARWNAALKQVQEQQGPLPAWAAALFLMRRAVEEWQRVDPSRRPAEWKIFERDTWQCRAPGCSSRRHLEAHHIIFRSQKGSDDPENLITLCHGHHRRGVHEGFLRVEGTAPGQLRWRLGAAPQPVRVFKGSLKMKAGTAASLPNVSEI